MIYFSIERNNQYFPVNEMKPGDAPFVGPKYPGIEESHKYGPVPARQGSDREMTGPIYPGVETANKFDVVNISILNFSSKDLLFTFLFQN